MEKVAYKDQNKKNKCLCFYDACDGVDADDIDEETVSFKLNSLSHRVYRVERVFYTFL